MNALFVNGSTEPQCGVNQFGKNLYAILAGSNNIQWAYHEATTVGAFRAVTSMPSPGAVLYNWQGGQGGILADAPFPWLRCPQSLVYHDLAVDENKWDAILFSDPTFTPRGKWHVIGRPLPQFDIPNVKMPLKLPTFGVHGFLGAWSDQVVHYVTQGFENAAIRLSLPFAKYGDSDGSKAMAMAERCMSMVANHPGIRLKITHDFLEPEALVFWLSQNDVNCYFRPGDMNWRGISSAPDFALAANKPIAINRCNAFRHLHGLSPSICIEDSSLTDIFSNGLSPLTAFKARWCDPQVIRDQVERVLMNLA